LGLLDGKFFTDQDEPVLIELVGNHGKLWRAHTHTHTHSLSPCYLSRLWIGARIDCSLKAESSRGS
jgi:hypothetical protein